MHNQYRKFSYLSSKEIIMRFGPFELNFFICYKIFMQIILGASNEIYTLL